MSFGKDLSAFGSDLFADPLKVVQVGYKGYNLGLTTDTTTLKPELDIKDIVFQQKGTKPDDHVITGADWMLSATFGEIKTELLVILCPYLVGSGGSVGADSGHIKAEMYKSMKDNYSGALKIAPVQDQVPQEDVDNTMYFYIAIPLINGDLVNWGADVQRNLPVDFRIKPKQMTAGESTTIKSAHGYWGDNSVEDLPAVDWPDLEAPAPSSSVVVSATEVMVTFGENITEIAGVTSSEQVVLKVGKKWVVPTTVSYATSIMTLTLPASSIVSGDVVSAYISAGTCEDGDSNANELVEDFPVTNNL